MENLFYVTKPLLGPASPDSPYETFPPLPAHSSYLRGVPKYSHASRSPSILQKVPKLFHRFVSSWNLSGVRNDLNVIDLCYLRLQLSLNIFGFPWWLFTIRSIPESLGFRQGNLEYWMNFPPW